MVTVCRVTSPCLLTVGISLLGLYHRDNRNHSKPFYLAISCLHCNPPISTRIHCESLLAVPQSSNALTTVLRPSTGPLLRFQTHQQQSGSRALSGCPKPQWNPISHSGIPSSHSGNSCLWWDPLVTVGATTCSGMPSVTVGALSRCGNYYLQWKPSHCGCLLSHSANPSVTVVTIGTP